MIKKREKYKSNDRNKKQLKKVITVVAEGKTEQKYICTLKMERCYVDYIEIECEPDRDKKSSGGGTDLKSLVKYAEKVEKQGREKYKGSYLGVWIVCDTDANYVHKNLVSEWLKHSGDKKGDSERNLAITGPSIEYWFLLHYEKGRKANVNGADSAVAELRKIITNYRKGNIPKGLINNTDEALKYARQNNKVPGKGCECLRETNFSQIPHLIEYLDTVVSRLSNR